MNKPTRYYSNNQEKRVAKKLNGKKQPNSGATNFIKGDVELKHFLLDCKTVTTPKKSVSIKKEWLDKIKQEAFAMGKNNSSICFNFEPNGQNFYIIDERTFQYLIQKMEEDYE